MSPDVVREWNGIVERMGMDECAGGNVANEDVGAFRVVGVLVAATTNSNYLSVRRICDGGGEESPTVPR